VNELARMTTEDAARALSTARLAVIPVGSLEQHGPHLTLDTDSAVAEAFARRIAAELAEDAVLCPTIGYGLSEHHLGFAGTLTLRPDTFLALIGDLLDSLAHHGIRRVLIVNGHGGNIDALRLAGRTARRDRGMLVASLMWATIAADAAAEAAHSPAYGHACEVETSLALALIPDRVRSEHIGAPAPTHSIDELTDPPGPLVDEAVWLEQWSEDGALGDPRLANEEAGRRIVEVATERALAFARRLADRPLPETNP
jgi:creatinine amidohydrolase